MNTTKREDTQLVTVTGDQAILHKGATAVVQNTGHGMWRVINSNGVEIQKCATVFLREGIDFQLSTTPTATPEQLAHLQIDPVSGPVKRTRKPEVNTSAYEFSHGHSPRGRGSWAFAVTANPKSDVIYWAKKLIPGTASETSSLTYTEAKKAAQAHFAGQEVIFVLS